MATGPIPSSWHACWKMKWSGVPEATHPACAAFDRQHTKSLETFDFAFNPAINRQQLLQLASCDFIRQQRNVLICGPTGTGKTHLAQALVQACRQGFDALFTSVTKLLQHLHSGQRRWHLGTPVADLSAA